MILEPAGLSSGDLDRVLGTMLGASVDDADVYMQNSRYESWSLEDGIVK
jgi:TldD protein